MTRMLFALLLLPVSVLLTPRPAAATEWVVSTIGDDDNGKGTVVKPFRTIGRVINTSNGVAKSGDTVILRGIPGNNVYRECDVRVRVKITLRSYPGELAHIHCDVGVKDSVVLQFDTDASGSVASDLELSGSAYYGVKLNTEWYPDGGEKLLGASDIVLENLKIHDTGRDGIKITPKANRITIRRSEIWNTGAIYPPSTPQSDKNADGIDNVGGSNMLVEDNYIHDVATTGLYFKGGARDCIVQRNRIENAAAGIRVGFDTSPEYFDLADNPHYYESIGGIVRNNYIRNTIYAGIALYGAKDATITNNTIVETARKGQAALFFGLTLQDGDPKAERPPTVNPKIEDNLISQKGAPCISIRWSITEIGMLSSLNGNPNTDRNTYYNAGGACEFVDDRPSPTMFIPKSLDGWRSREQSDRNSIETVFAVDEATGQLLNGHGASVGRGVVETARTHATN